MKTRVITALILILVLVPLIFISNPYPLIGLGALVVLIATREYLGLTKNTPLYYLMNMVVYLSLVLGYMQVDQSVFQPVLISMKVVGGILLVYALQLVISDRKLDRFVQPLFHIAYIGLGAGTLMTLKVIDHNILIYLVLVITFTDAFAYFFGIRFGKNRLAPNISPKKSIEGAIAGTFFGSLAGIVFLLLMNIEALEVFGLFTLVFITLSLSIIGQFGDLFASKIKRHYEVKDFGNLFPGHGGVLDRFDSLLLASMMLLMFLI